MVKTNRLWQGNGGIPDGVLCQVASCCVRPGKSPVYGCPHGVGHFPALFNSALDNSMDGVCPEDKTSLRGLCSGERTGSSVFHELWLDVLDLSLRRAYIWRAGSSGLLTS